MIQKRARAIFGQYEQIAQQHAEIQKPLHEFFPRPRFHRRPALEDLLDRKRGQLHQKRCCIITECQPAALVKRERPAKAPVRQRGKFRRKILRDAA